MSWSEYFSYLSYGQFIFVFLHFYSFNLCIFNAPVFYSEWRHAWKTLFLTSYHAIFSTPPAMLADTHPYFWCKAHLLSLFCKVIFMFILTPYQAPFIFVIFNYISKPGRIHILTLFFHCSFKYLIFMFVLLNKNKINFQDPKLSQIGLWYFIIFICYFTEEQHIFKFESFDLKYD